MRWQHLKRKLTKLAGAVVFFAAGMVLMTACSRKAALTLTVASTPSTERGILVEIAAQHLEKQLGTPVIRKVDLGSTSIGYESLVMSAIDVWAEDTNAIGVSVLKDPVDASPDITLERVRGEMARIGRIHVFNALGIRRRMAIVVRASDARDAKLETIADAGRSQLGWTLGTTSEFEQRPDGYSALMSTYKLRLATAPRTMLKGMLYPSLSQNQVSMVAGYDTDGALAEPEFAMLKDNLGAFRESRTCLLVREEALEREPKVRTALDQLSGKFTNDSIRKLNYEVDGSRRAVKDVAAGFLRQAGL
jgi:glycine betaine/choline ABC-type transport system substrate-binding protein